MGSFRFALAVLVMMSHAPIQVFGHDVGVIAVISFLLMSGFVMTPLIQTHYLHPARFPAFWLDRLARLYPQFLVWLLLSLPVIWLSHAPQPVTTLTLAGVLMHLALLPMNIVFWLMPGWQYMPQSWSLGLESLFYLLIPAIMYWRLRAGLFAASLAFFLLPYGGWLDTDLFGYRLLPGTLFIFLCGSYLFSGRGQRLAVVPLLTFAAALAMFAGLQIWPGLQVPYNWEVLFGLLVGIPAIWLLRDQPGGVLDALLGDLSYGVFLNHNLFLWTARDLGFDPDRLGVFLPCLAGATALSLVTYRLVETPFLRLRRSLRSPIAPV